jgi:subtilisin
LLYIFLGARTMPNSNKEQQFVVLPPRGVRLASTSTNHTLRSFLGSFPRADGASKARTFSLSTGPKVKMKVLDTIGENGAKLIEMSANGMSDLRAHAPGLRIVPVTYFKTAVAPRLVPLSKPKKAANRATVKIVLKVVSSVDGSPIANADVVAFTDFANGIGADGATRSNGKVSLALGGSSASIERLYIFPRMVFWGLLKKNVLLSTGMEFGLKPIDLSFKDSLRHFYGNAPDDAGEGVKVAVIDTGVGPHGDLIVEGGENTVVGESASAFGDNGDGHGTHVAGIIAAHGMPPTGLRGLAPSVTLRSYRVFGKGSDEASNFAIAKAIDRAVADGCDLINMSLGGGDPDDATEDAIADARSAGSVCIVAAGNDSRSPVSFPALNSLSIAISAMGRKGTFPKGATQSGEVASPFGKSDKKNFIAAFSNVGPEIDLTGPGVGVISTVPGGYAALDGTSMACPAVTGAAARLLAENQQVLNMSRDSSRADAIAKLILQTARKLGFGPNFEGQGML